MSAPPEENLEREGARPRQEIRSMQLVLLDIDGVIVGGKDHPRLLSGKRLVDALRDTGRPFRLVTNNTTLGPHGLAERLAGLGLTVAPDEILSTLTATVRRVALEHRGRRCLVIGEQRLRDELARAGLTMVETDPADVVVVALSRQVEHRGLSGAARALLAGAPLYACHRNKLFVDDDGKKALNAGAWVAALEHATGARATVIGKPETAFFREATASLGVAPEATLMVGDDLDADVGGAQLAGHRGALVLTGKTDLRRLAGHRVRPDWVFQEADDLLPWLG